MTMEIELEATATFNIYLNEDMIMDVMQNCNGDFEEWAKSNYSDFMSFDDFDIEYDGCDYDKDEAKELILKSKDVLGLDDDFNVDRVIAHRTMLNKFLGDAPAVEDELEELKIDVELVAKAKNFTDFKNPKFELNYIHLDKNTISATDTKKLIHITNHKYNDFDNVLLPPCFIEPLQKGAELYKNCDGFIYMKYNNRWYISDLSESWGDAKFPEVKNILLSKDGYKNKKTISFAKFSSDSIISKYTSDTCPKELIRCKLEDEAVFIRGICYNEVIHLHNDFKNVYFNGIQPIYFIGDDTQVIIMPVV